MTLENGPSPHLSWQELGCKDGTAYPKAFILDGRAARLAAVFEIIRQACGHVPIAILSAYRTPAHNRSIGGARNSQHLEGRALDLRPPKGWTIERFYALIVGLAQGDVPDIRGIGKYATFVHVDIRPTTLLARWNGGAATKDANG